MKRALARGMKSRQQAEARDDLDGGGGDTGIAPGRRTLTSRFASRAPSVEDIAAEGVAGAGAPLPYLTELKASFGRHAGALDGATAHVGGAAGEAAGAIGARAYATGDRLGFESAPDRALIAHEAAHIVQQQAGVHRKAELGDETDELERNADDVGAAFAAGDSVEALLDPYATDAAAPEPVLQLKKKKGNWAKVTADAVTGSVLDPIPGVGWLRKKAGGLLEDVLLGVQRTGEGLFGGEDRQVQIGIEFDQMVALVVQLLANPIQTIELVSGAVIVHSVTKMLTNLPAEQRRKLERDVTTKFGVKVAGEAFKVFLAAMIKKRMIAAIVQKVIASAPYQSLAAALSMAPGRVGPKGQTPGAGLAGIAVTLLQAQGVMQKAGWARERCQSDHPALFRELASHDLDMACFLIEDILLPLDIAVNLYAFKTLLFD
jgi:hypothetical protein